MNMIKETNLEGMPNSRPWIHKGGYREPIDTNPDPNLLRMPKFNTYDWFMVLDPSEHITITIKQPDRPDDGGVAPHRN